MRYARHVRLFVTGVVGALTILGFASTGASSANLSHSYQATGTIPNGSIVSLDSRQQGYVQLANTDNGNRILGVALLSKDSLLAVDATTGTIQVATNGSVNTLVSTVDGAIGVGDQVSVSPFAGIGMKATPGSHVVGVAQTAFSESSAGATTETVKDKTGKSQQIKLGYVRVGIAIGSAGVTGAGSADSAQVNFVQQVVKSLTGHTVSTVRIVLSLVVTIISLTSLITLIYASVYGSIISIGRNPLARGAVFRTLSSVLIVAVLTVVVAGVTIYYLLR